MIEASSGLLPASKRQASHVRHNPSLTVQVIVWAFKYSQQSVRLWIMQGTLMSMGHTKFHLHLYLSRSVSAKGTQV